jgi:hypothetical protein
MARINRFYEGTSGTSGTNTNTTQNTTKTDDNNLNNNLDEKKNFKMPDKAEEILDLYITKLEDFYNQIENDKKDVISQKAKVLEAILNTDILKID